MRRSVVRWTAIYYRDVESWSPKRFGQRYAQKYIVGAQGKKTDWTYPRMKIARRQASKKTSSSKVVATTPHKKNKKK